MRINTNISALNSYNQLRNTNQAMNKSLERLSSGKRINSAADDAAGLAISEKMNSQIKGLAQAQRNAQDGISMIQTAEGALKETHSILQRMRELSIQASNGTNTDADRAELQKEMSQLSNEIDRIADTTEFNTKKLLDGSQEDKSAWATSSDTGVAAIGGEVEFNGTYTVRAYEDANENMVSGAVEVLNENGEVVARNTAGTTVTFDNITFTASAAGTTTEIDITAGAQDSTSTGANNSVAFQIGANGGQDTTLNIKSMSASDLQVNTGTINVNTQGDAEISVGVLDKAIAKVSTERSKLGAKQNRLEHTINNLSVAEENLTAAQSRIRDVDMAREMMSMTKNQILSQAGTAMLAQANQRPQGVLQLLG